MVFYLEIDQILLKTCSEKYKTSMGRERLQIVVQVYKYFVFLFMYTGFRIALNVLKNIKNYFLLFYLHKLCEGCS